MTSNLGVLELENYRHYLRLLVRMALDPELMAKVDASDIVQETMLEAHRDYDRFRGCQRGEQIRWLRQILANNLADQVRRFTRRKRDCSRERSMDEAVHHSSCQLQHFLATQHTSPSQEAMRNEEVLQMTRALAGLPEPQQRAITLHHLQGLKVSEVAQVLGRSEVAVAGLLRRGLKSLRQACQS